MRRLPTAFFLYLCVLLVGAYGHVAYAASTTQAPPTYPPECPAGISTGDPSGSKTFTTEKAQEIEQHLKRVVYCANVCYDERMTVQVSPGILQTGVTIVTSAENACGVSNPSVEDVAKSKRGCGQGETQPTVTITVPSISALGVTILPARTIGPKSRCDTSIGNLTSSMFDSASKGDFKSLENDLVALQNLPPTAPPTQNVGTDALTSALTNFGLSADQAQTLAKEKPIAAGDLIKAFQTRDPSQIQEAANAAGITLNQDLVDDIAHLTPAQADEKAAPITSLDTPSKDSTFPSNDTSALSSANSRTMLPTQCGSPGIAGNMMLAESSCGRNTYNSINPNVHGPLQYTCGTWAQDTTATGYAQYSNCSYANNPQVVTTVANARYAQFQQTYGNVCTSAGLSVTSCQYAIHVFGESGFRNMLGAYMANPAAPASSLCGRALGWSACSNNASILNNGGTIDGVFSELDRRLTGTSVIGSVVNRTPPFSNIGNPYATLVPGNIGYPASPFGNVSPGYSLMQPVSAPQQLGQLSAPQQQQSQAQTSGQQVSTPTQTSLQQQQSTPTLAGPSQTLAPVLQPAALIIAQPATVAPGGSVQVSWATVGMRADAPCRVFSNDVYVLAQGNDGTIFATSSPTHSGSWTFKLTCTAASGTAITQTTSVDVH